MKSIISTNRITDRLIAFFNKMFIRHRGSDKFRILTNAKPSDLNQQTLKISQSHW
jgi:hypothetical protein